MTPIFVLSAGRTGTVFLTRTLPAHVPQLHAAHEPPGSRSMLMAANATHQLHARSLLLPALRQQLRRRIDACPPHQRYVEVNPMLCPLADQLHRIVEPLHLVHLVRHPVSWTRSMRAFRASSWRRPLIDHVPFANPAPAPFPDGWLGLDRVQRALWRWRACNLAIEQAPSARTTRLRYEDLFLADDATRRRTLLALLEALEVEAPSDLTPLLRAPRANPAPPAEPVAVPAVTVQRIADELLDRYGYDADGSTRSLPSPVVATST